MHMLNLAVIRNQFVRLRPPSPPSFPVSTSGQIPDDLASTPRARWSRAARLVSKSMHGQ